MHRPAVTAPAPRGLAPGRRRPVRRLARASAAAALGLVPILALLATGAAAAEPLALALPGPFPPIRALTLLIALHLIGLCFGLGGATMLDFWILRWMRWGSLPSEIARIFLFISKVVSVGIGLLWVSGLGFLLVYALENPGKLQNPKLWAKVTVVAVLTLNGLVIHALVLPGVLRDVSRPMLDGISGARTGIFLVSGAVSGVSWYTAFALGLMRELNGTVAYGLLIGLWIAGMVAASLGAYMFWLHLREWSARRQVPAGEIPAADIPAASPLALPAAGSGIPASQIIPISASSALQRA